MPYPTKLFCYNKHDYGYITLISVLVVGAVGVAITTFLIMSGLASSRTSFALEQSAQAKALANACAEEALRKIIESSFIGTGTISLDTGICTYAITSQGGQKRTIKAIGTVDNIVRKVKIIINRISPTIKITSWQELAEF